MYRVEASLLARVLFYLLYNRIQGATNTRGVRDAVWNRFFRGDLPRPNWATDRMTDALQLTMGRGEMPEQWSLEEDIDKICQYLCSETNQSSDGSIIEALSNVIQGSFAKNHLSRDLLIAIRRAILIPAEQRKVAQKIVENPLTCPRCEHVIQPGECVTFTNEVSEDGRGFISNPVVHCSQCAPPQVFRCDHHECNALVDGTIQKKKFCPDHDGKVKEKPAEDIWGEQMIAINGATTPPLRRMNATRIPGIWPRRRDRLEPEEGEP